GERYELRRDALGRIVEEVDYWGQGQRFSYTPSGHLRESVDPLGRSIRYETDPLGRIRKKILLEPANPQSQQVETFEYDANGNLMSMKNAHAEITRTFDAEGRLIREAQGQDFILENTYDRSGNRIARKTSLGNCVAYEFDPLNQVSSVRFDDSEPIRIERD